MRILLVEDDRTICAAVTRALKDAAYAIDWVMDGETAIEAAEVEPCDLALLDLGLPAADGLEILWRFRKVGRQLPVIIVTARDRIDDRIDRLDLGAADYLVKPFGIRKLLARIRAIPLQQGSGALPILSNGKISLNPATCKAGHGGESCRLTARESSPLQALLMRPAAILSRNDLEWQIYGWNEEVESNAIEFLIYAIRKNIGARTISNVRGVGWIVDRPS